MTVVLSSLILMQLDDLCKNAEFTQVMTYLLLLSED